MYAKFVLPFVALLLLSGTVRAGVICNDWAGEVIMGEVEVDPNPVPVLTDGRTNSCGSEVALTSSIELQADFGGRHFLEIAVCSDKAYLPQSLRLPDPIPIKLLKIPIQP